MTANMVAGAAEAGAESDRLDPAARALLDERVVGESLPAPFYVDREWFDLSLIHI